MALDIREKFLYYQNTELLLKDDAFETAVRSIANEQDTSVHFYNPDVLYFQSTDSFLSNNYCKFKHTVLQDDGISLLNSKLNNKNYQEVHVIRNKGSCTLIVGDYTLGRMNEPNLEKRLINSFAGECARLNDSDLYSCHIDQIDNTSLVLKVKKILQYLTQFNYNAVNIIFQCVDPARCFNSKWWQPHKTNNFEPILKQHPSYHFITKDSIYQLIEDYTDKASFLFDSYLFTLSSKKASKAVLSPHEFYQLCELSTIDFLTKIVQQYKKYYKIKYFLWKDFFAVCNTSIKNVLCDVTLIEFFKNKKMDLPYDSLEGRYVKDRTNILIEENVQSYVDLKDYIPKNQTVVYNTIIEPSALTKNLFTDSSPSRYPAVDNEWKFTHFDSDVHSQFARQIFLKAGWHNQKQML